jgi:hypothetical protein
MAKKIPLEVRFKKWTDRTSETGCWIWTGKINRYGYAHIKHNGWDQRAARVSYEFHKGPIPEGLTIDHLCRNRACVNPDHLEAVTQKVNWYRGTAPAKFIRRGPQKFICEKCGGPRESTKSGHGSSTMQICKPCRAKYVKEWREKNLVANREKQAAWRERNPTASRDYYIANRERINAQRRIRRASNKEK